MLNSNRLANFGYGPGLDKDLKSSLQFKQANFSPALVKKNSEMREDKVCFTVKCVL